MPTWVVVIFTIIGGAAVLKILHALAIVVVHPVTQGAMFTSTARVKIRKALDAVPMKPGELFVDIGCGDGRVLRVARKRYGVTCLGFEINPIAFTKAKLLTMGRKGLEVRCRNFWKADLGKANIVSCYLFPDVMRRLGEKLGKGTGRRGSCHLLQLSHTRMEAPGRPPRRLQTQQRPDLHLQHPGFPPRFFHRSLITDHRSLSLRHAHSRIPVSFPILSLVTNH